MSDKDAPVQSKPLSADRASIILAELTAAGMPVSEYEILFKPVIQQYGDERAEAERERLMPYCTHKKDCPRGIYPGGPPKCTCGYEALEGGE